MKYDEDDPKPTWVGNVASWDFQYGWRSDGSMSGVGMKVCDAYAKRWATTGERDLEAEVRHPELAGRFAAIRTDAEVLEYHLIELPRPEGGLAPVSLFPRERPAKRNPHEWIELLVADAEGAYDFWCHPIYSTRDDRLSFSDLEAPVEAVRMLRFGQVRVPGTVLIARGSLRGVYIAYDDWSAAEELASRCAR